MTSFDFQQFYPFGPNSPSPNEHWDSEKIPPSFVIVASSSSCLCQPQLHCTDLDAGFAHSDLFDVSCLLRSFRKCSNTEFWTRISTLYSLLRAFSSFPIQLQLSNFPKWLFSNLQQSWMWQLFPVAVTKSWVCCRQNCEMWSRCCSDYLISIFILLPRLLVPFCLLSK